MNPSPGPEVPLGTGVVPGPRGPRWRELADSKEFRRALSFVLAFLVLAVMTGPSGSATAPLSGFTGSLFAPACSSSSRSGWRCGA